MTTFRFHTRVPAAPDEVWAVLTDVARIPEWFPGIAAARFDGEHRILTLADGGTLRARVVTADGVLRRFQYRFVDGMPLPIAYHLGTLDVIEDGAGSLVVYSQEIEPAALGAQVGPAVRGGMEGISARFGGTTVAGSAVTPAGGGAAGGPGRVPAAGSAVGAAGPAGS